MYGSIEPNTWLAIQLPSLQLKVIQIVPNTQISLGKTGSFSTNLLLGRPYHHTYEILESANETTLRVVPPKELASYFDAKSGDADIEEAEEEEHDGQNTPLDEKRIDGLVEELRNNQTIVDDNATQKLTMAEIESLKKSDTAAGREVIAKILASHTSLDKKTRFSLAKYTARKVRKYAKRFTPLPLDVNLLRQYFLVEKDAVKVMEVREEMFALMMSWSNVHCMQQVEQPGYSKGRWLVVDDASGLVVAGMAERMGILHPSNGNAALIEASNGHGADAKNASIIAQETHMAGKQNTITVIHSNTQPNLSLLTYFGYDTNNSDPAHPLHSHLKTLSWLQLISPEEDGTYSQEPPELSTEQLAAMKGGKKGTYHRKRRRWARIVSLVDETRAGGFDGLLIATHMRILPILHQTVPLLSGGAQVVVYSPSIEPLLPAMDAYSSARRTAFINLLAEQESGAEGTEGDVDVPSDDFPVDPRLLLNTSIYSARAREYQVLPGRTHPVMTARGGPDGFLFVGTRVLPMKGKVESRGNFAKRRKTAPAETTMATPETPTRDTMMTETTTL